MNLAVVNQSQHGHFGCFWSPADSRQVTWQFTMVQVGVSFSCFCLSPVLPPFLLVCSSCSLCLSSLSSLCVACLLFFLLFFVCLPPCFFFLFSSFFFLLFWLSLLVFSLLSLFCSPIFFEQAVVTTTKESHQGHANKQKKIIDNSGWVWLTGVNRASLKMGLNLASLFTGPFQGVVNVPAGRSVGLRVYARAPADILELQSRYSPP